MRYRHCSLIAPQMSDRKSTNRPTRSSPANDTTYLTLASSKIGLWGGSYGGYLTALGMGRNPEIFKAGVDLHGVHDWFAHLWL